MITVFTPTFNRGHLIDTLYQSLLKQTNKDFEWIVIDDGSTDRTEAYFTEILAKHNPFEIIYRKQPNGGKHRAINAGVQIAKGELFFIVDSDDYLTEDAIEKLSEWRNSLDDSKKWAGVSGTRGYSSEQCIGGDGGNHAYIDAKNTQREKFGLCGDKAEAYFTELLRRYPFPEFKGENFITEEVVWNAIAFDGYYLRWFKDIIYICEYLEGGLTQSGDTKFKNNPKGVLFWAKLQMLVFPHGLKRKLASVYRYYKAVSETKSIKEIAQDLGVSRLFCCLAVTAGKIRKA